MLGIKKGVAEDSHNVGNLGEEEQAAVTNCAEEGRRVEKDGHREGDGDAHGAAAEKGGGSKVVLQIDEEKSLHQSHAGSKDGHLGQKEQNGSAQQTVEQTSQLLFCVIAVIPVSNDGVLGGSVVGLLLARGRRDTKRTGLEAYSLTGTTWNCILERNMFCSLSYENTSAILVSARNNK